MTVREVIAVKTRLGRMIRWPLIGSVIHHHLQPSDDMSLTEHSPPPAG